MDTVESQTAENTVYIAGNPDLYPIEYYDSTEKVYKGIIPDLYEKISQFSGLNFTYICAGEKKQQSRLAKTTRQRSSLPMSRAKSTAATPNTPF